MAGASQNVGVTITLKGQDQASGAINSVAKSADQFAKHGDNAADRAGKLSTALSSLGDFAGKSEGAFRTASEAAGAFDDVLTIMPGPVGLLVGALGGLTTVLILQAKAAAETRARFEQAFGSESVAVLSKFKDELGISAEAMVAMKKAADESGRTLTSMRDEMKRVVQRAEAIGEDGSAAIQRFADNLRRALTPAQKLEASLARIGVRRGQVTITAGTGASGDVAALAAQEQAKFQKQILAVGGDIEKTEARIAKIRETRQARSTHELADLQFRLKVLTQVRSDILDNVQTTQSNINRLVRGEVKAREMAARAEEAAIRAREKTKAGQRKRSRVGKSDAETFDAEQFQGLQDAMDAVAAHAKVVQDAEYNFEVNFQNRKLELHKRTEEAKLAESKKAAAEQRRLEQERLDAINTRIGQVQQFGAALQGLLADEKGMETERAAIQLAMTLGEAARLAIKSYYEGDYAGIAFAAANAGIALAQFGKIATRGSGGAGSFDPATYGGGAGGGGGGLRSSSGAGGGGRNVTIVFGQGVIMGDEHTVARTVKGALTRIEGTGY